MVFKDTGMMSEGISMTLRDLPGDPGWEILIHQEVALSWISTKQRKGYMSQCKGLSSRALCPISHRKRRAAGYRKPAAFTNELPRPLPSTAKPLLVFCFLLFSDSSLNNCTFLNIMSHWKQKRPSIFRPQFRKHSEVLGVLFLN